MRDGDVPVYAAAPVAREIEQIAEAKRAQWGPVYGEEWPAGTYYPNSPMADRGQVRLDELTFTVHAMGPAESYVALAADGMAPVALAADRGELAPVPAGLITGNTYQRGTRPPFRPAAVLEAIRRVLARPRTTGREITAIIGPPDFMTSSRARARMATQNRVGRCQ